MACCSSSSSAGSGRAADLGLADRALSSRFSGLVRGTTSYVFKDLFGRMKRDRQARDDAERDAPKEMGRPVSRETGGDPQPGAQDANSSTGTTPNETFVGRAGGDESGDVQTSGSEMRAGETDMDDQGAARDE